LAALDAGDIKLFIGGTIPVEDHDTLTEAGVCGIYTAEMAIDDVLAAIDAELAA
jgi:methylmalonyl-CoA mutase C-terminal domain/subunit